MRFLSSPKRPNQFCGPATFPFNGYWGFFLSQEARHLRCKVNNSRPFSAVVKNVCSYASTPPVSLWQAQGTNFTFLHTWWWKQIHFLKCSVLKSH